MLRIEKIEGVVWDLDGVLHRYRPFAESLSHYNQAAVRAFNTVARNHGIRHDIPNDIAQIMAHQSFHDHGLSTAVFTQDYNLPSREMHIEFHRETEMDRVIAAHPELPEHFEKLSHLTHVIVSQGSEEWVERCLEANGLTRYFSAIVSFEACGLEKKKSSSLPHRMGIEASGLKAENLAFVEDMKKNLIKAKEEGMQTVFIAESGLEPQWIDLPNENDSYIDLSVRQTSDFLTHITPIPAL